MKLVVFQENLNKGLNTASRFVSSKSQLPILENFLLEAENGFLKISATNLETGIKLKIPCKVSSPGKICVPARVLTEYIASLPAGKVELIEKENKLKVQLENFSSEFLGIASSEFPAMPEKGGGRDIVFEKEILTKAIGLVAFSASTDESRPVLTGVLFVVREKKLMLVATDGYRLSLKTLTKTPSLFSEIEKGLIIPARTLIELSRIIEGQQDEKVRLSINRKASQLIFSAADAEIISQLIEGEYPDFEKIIPKSGKTKITVDSQEFSRAVKIASIFARESANVIRFKFDKDKLEVASSTAQVGSNKNEISAQIEGEKGEIAFNCRYLLDFLNICKSERVEFGFDSSLSPGVFSFPGKQDFCHIIMPIRVQD